MEFLNDYRIGVHPGHYTLGTSSCGLTFISGQLPIDWNGTGQLVTGGIEAQTRQALENLKAALASAGMDFTNVLKTTVLVSGVEYWPDVDRIYKEYFGPHKPSRTVIPTLPLHYGALVEIEAIAENKRG